MRLVVWLGVLAAACSLPRVRPDRSSFFALTVTEVADGHAPASTEVTIGLGPVAIPGYLDRPQLVTRVGPNELRLATVARWAEPLRDGLVRTLAQDLVAASGARQVALYPWTSTARLDFSVGVEVIRFEAALDGAAELVARWSVREGGRGRVLAVRESRVAEPVEGTGPGAEVAALSRALGALGRDIAAAVREKRSPSR